MLFLKSFSSSVSPASSPPSFTSLFFLSLSFPSLLSHTSLPSCHFPRPFVLFSRPFIPYFLHFPPILPSPHLPYLSRRPPLPLPLPTPPVPYPDLLSTSWLCQSERVGGGESLFYSVCRDGWSPVFFRVRFLGGSVSASFFYPMMGHLDSRVTSPLQN